jgi:glutamate 5-kinase
MIRNTLKSIFELGAVPIINENDAVAAEEIRFGDNDVLSSLVASNIDADLLVLMSNMDGLFTHDPMRDGRAIKISEVDSKTKGLSKLDGKTYGGGTGGIKSKIEAGKMMMECGIPMAIVDSRMKDVLKRLIRGDHVGTVFYPKAGIENKRQWMLFSSKPKGGVVVDEGAKKKLLSGKASLLPVGVTNVKGQFRKGDVVSIICERDEFARGITNFSSEDIRKVKGLKCEHMLKALGRKTCKEIIIQDNIVAVKR